MIDEPGRWLDHGRLHLDELLGEGSFGSVWRATEFLGFGAEGTPIELRQVAVKWLPPLTSTADVERVVDEARALADLNHDAILRLHDAFADPEGTYLVTELASAGDLEEFFGSAVPSTQELADLFISVAQGLAYLHARGCVHGDLKPENVLVSETEDGDCRFLLADFGLHALIGHGAFQGTVPFIAPEAYAPTGVELTDRADVYALGLVTFEVASGRRLSEALTPETIEALRGSELAADEVRQIHREIQTAIARTDWAALGLPSFLPTLVGMCTALDPAQRPSAQGAVDLWEAFQRGRQGVIAPDEDRSGSRSDRYQLRFARLVDVESLGGPATQDEAVVATMTGDDGVLTQLRVERAANARMYEALESAANDWSDDPPILSAYGLVLDGADRIGFTADRDSYLVIAPFELIDVTDMSASHLCARAYFHRAVGGRERPSAPLLKGNLLHTLFADLLTDDGTDFEDAWPELWRDSCLDLAHVIRSNADLDAFRHDLSQAFVRMRDAMQSEQTWFTPLRHVESTRWSTQLGLAGRADAFFLSENGRASAYELKTGKLRQEDLLQVQAYGAILAEGLGAKRDGVVRTQILTSSDGRFRRPAGTPPVVLMTSIRNEILAVRRRLRAPRTHDTPMPVGYPHYGYDRPKCSRCATSQRYLNRACRDSTALLGERDDLAGDTLTPTEQDYFWHWTRLLLREEDAFRRNYLHPMLQAGQLGWDAEVTTPQYGRHRIDDARLLQVEDGAFTLGFAPTSAVFNVGDDVLLHGGDIRLWAEVHRGTITDLTDTSMAVDVRSPRAEALARTEVGTDWVVEYFPDTRGAQALRQALNLFIRSPNKRMKALVLEGRMPRRQGELFHADGSSDLELAHGRRLNQAQRRALLKALDENGFLSITGPPGTGKTMTIHAIVEATVQQGARVLVATLTNRAIDNVADRLIGVDAAGTIPFLRFGSRTAMHAQFAERLESFGRDPRQHFVQEVGAALHDVESVRELLGTVPVLIGTAHSLIGSPWITETPADVPPYDLVIIDEATQMQEPFAAALLSLGDKSVLVGDEHQLGPVCMSTFDEALDGVPGSLKDLEVAGLDKSLFERLNAVLDSRGRDGQIFLSRQYRMPALVGEWASEEFYEGRLETADVAARGSEVLASAAGRQGWRMLRDILDPSRPVVFLDVPTKPGSPPNASTEEARVAALLVRALAEVGLTDVGCITPYRNQQALLLRHLQPLESSCEIGTVDAFQGREKSVIILSTVRRDRLTEFLTQPQRLNVSVTRAQAKCIILGSRAVLRDCRLLWSLVSRDGCLRETVDAATLEEELGASAAAASDA